MAPAVAGWIDDVRDLVMRAQSLAESHDEWRVGVLLYQRAVP
jgi:hypothetical protein